MTVQTTIVFGGSSGIGEATARAAKRAEHRVVIVGRDERKLAAAAKRLEGVETISADATERASVDAAFQKVGSVDHVVICVSGGKGAGPFADLNLADVREAFEAKTLAQLTIAQSALKYVQKGGSLTFVGAASTRSVIPGTVGLAAVNGAIETAIPILAKELAPLRVNAVSPGIIDTDWWNAMPKAAKESFFKTAEKQLPVGRVGKPEEVANVILCLIQTGFVTGSIFECDGGSHLVAP
ncbi:MAG: SDR family oxidoreductase [Polyangiaceae bacterium]